MDPDLFLVFGLVTAALTIPAVLSALNDGRVPRAPAILVMIAGVLIVLALNNKPNGYAIAEIPDAFYRVFDRYLN